MAQLPLYVSIVFIITTAITGWLFIRSFHNKMVPALLSFTWLGITGILGYLGYFVQADGLPPRMVLQAIPPFLTILLLFVLPAGRKLLDRLNQSALTWIHTVRVPVEVVLFWLFAYRYVPEIMTFEGRNFDILSGITAPVMVLLAFHKKIIPGKILFLWNVICLLLLINIVVTAVLSAPFMFQQMAFEQPNIGVLYFPFNWLPGFIVPVVLFAHLAQLRFLLKKVTPL